MPPSSPSIPRHFLTWDRPWLPQVVAWLADGWDGKGPLDLSGLLAVVPTRQSGRRLREALAEFAGERGQAVFAPRVVTPEVLVEPVEREPVATRLESILTWTEVLRTAELDALRSVFPLDPPEQDFAWALGLAQELNRLQVALAGAGLRLAEVVARAGPNFVETGRWEDLAELEARHVALLARNGRRDPHHARIEAAGQAWHETDVTRVVALATPELPALACRRLQALAARTRVEIVVFAAETERDSFDEWGRPSVERWESRRLTIPHFEQRVHLCADPAAQAERVARAVVEYPAPDGAVGVGVADPEIAPLLENELRRRRQPVFDPEGRPLRGSGLHRLLASLAALARDPTFEAVEALARCPDFIACLSAAANDGFSTVDWLDGLDELRSRHLPADLEAALARAQHRPRFARVASGLETMARLRERLAGPDFAATIIAVLQEIFAARGTQEILAADPQWEEAAAGWAEIVRECRELASRYDRLTAAEWWELALRLFSERRVAETKPPGALELQGWLELLWEPARHLVVAGMNDGSVPEAIVDNTFLPEGLRARLGLETNASRQARDAYILQAISASRSGGRLDLVLGKTSAAGDPLRPSRLLLKCDDDVLPERIRWLFRAAPLPAANAPWTRSWKLRPRDVPPPGSVAVTALRRYLACPFRFYLRTVLGMDTVDPLKSEMDAFDFGTLCHGALEQIGRRPELRDATDPATLRAALWSLLDGAVRERYGDDLALPLVVQVESARQRLGRLAELQAGERAAGWTIVEVERPFEVEIAGLRVRGKIDRIDRQADSGMVRVIDYKTSDRPVTAAAAHLRPVRAAEQLPDWAWFEHEGRPHTWTDLQLPLYLRALAVEFPGRPACGYFNLPKAVGETTLAMWDDYTPELHSAAQVCAEGVCAAIREGVFWPPNTGIPPERDECAALFHHGVEESIDWRPKG